MGDTKKNDLVDEIFDDIDNLFRPNDVPVGYKAVTVWLPEDYHERYGILQEKSSRRFGKKIKELFMRAIDKADL